MDITFYDTVEEMLDDLSKAMQEADKRVKPWQAQIKKGDYFRQETEYGFDVYGQVLHGYREKRLRNYRFCYCFSPACPEGERGDVHTSVITEVITKEEFEQKKKKLRGG